MYCVLLTNCNYEMHFIYAVNINLILDTLFLNKVTIVCGKYKNEVYKKYECDRKAIK